MKFLYPEILWGLLALVIPILVHLFNFRKFKKVLFSNVEFLKDIKQETQSKSKLKHLLILFSRLLAITAIVLAFAQPFIPISEDSVKPNSNAISFYIDNSFSMESENEGGRLLDISKNKAMEVLDIYKSSDKFQLITNDFEGRHQRFVSKEEMIDLIEEIDLGPQVRSLKDVISRQKDLLIEEKDANKISYLFTDLQKSSSSLENIIPDSVVKIRLVPDIGIEQANCFVDSVWFESPVRQINQSERLGIRLINTSSKTVRDIPVKLIIDGNQKAVASFDLEPNSTLDTIMVFTNTSPGIKSAKIQIKDFPVEFDNDYYFSYNVAKQINIYEIKNRNINNSSFSKLFSDDPYYEYRSASEAQIDYGLLNENDFVILNQLNDIPTGLASELKKFITNGGSLYIIPGLTISTSNYNSFLQSIGGPLINGLNNSSNRVADLNLKHPIFESVYEKIPDNLNLPELNSFYELNVSGNNNAKLLLTNRDGSPFLTENIYGNGKVYTCAVSLNNSQSNFSNHSIFVTTSLRIAQFSQPVLPLHYKIGSGESIILRNQKSEPEDIYRIKNKKGDFEFLPGVRTSEGLTELFVYEQLKTGGLYDIVLNNDLISSVAFNYSREESDLSNYTIDEIQDQINRNGLDQFKLVLAGTESIQGRAEELADGKKLWRLLIILALLFLGIEILLIKLWK